MTDSKLGPGARQEFIAALLAGADDLFKNPDVVPVIQAFLKDRAEVVVRRDQIIIRMVAEDAEAAGVKLTPKSGDEPPNFGMYL